MPPDNPAATTPAPAATTTATTAPAAATSPAASASPAAVGAAGAPASPGGAASSTDVNVIADAGKSPAFNAEEARKFLTEKGAKAEELAALDEAALKAKFEEAKAAAEKPVTADQIEIKTPEGFTVDEKVLTEFKATLADAKLSPSEKGQKLVDMHVAALKQAVEYPMTYWRDLQTKWVSEIKADKEIGGQNFDASQKVFQTALAFYDSKYGADAGKGLREALAMTGAGNNPHIARLIFSRFKDDVESGTVSGRPADAESNFKKSVNSMYPTANPVS